MSGPISFDQGTDINLRWVTVRRRKESQTLLQSRREDGWTDENLRRESRSSMPVDWAVLQVYK